MFRSNEFNLILLGTDTNIEHPEVKMPGYERGELLNGIMRCLAGAEFVDKHIQSGPETLGRNVDKCVAEAIWMVLKAISEGKTTIKVAGHSRGGVEAILLANALETIMTALENTDADHIEGLLKKTNIGFINAAVRNAYKRNGDEISFQSNQNQLDANGNSHIVSHTHTLKISRLVSNIKRGDLARQLRMELFIIDPVAGQSGLGVYNWVKKRFFNIPNIVRKARFIYNEDERSSMFEPIIPSHLPKDADIKFISSPGCHATGPGFYTETDGRVPTAIAEDDVVTSFIDEQGEPIKINLSDRINTTDFMKRTDKKGKKTRHVHKLMSAFAVEFFGVHSFNIPKPSDLVRDRSGEIPSITKSINRRVKFFGGIDEYKLNLYNKIYERRGEYAKLRNSCYINPPGIPKKLNRFHLAYRTVITGTGNKDCLPYTAAHPSLGGARDGYVNDEHFQLHMQHENRMRLREEIYREVRAEVVRESEVSRKNFEANMALQLEGLKQQTDALLNRQAELDIRAKQVAEREQAYQVQVDAPAVEEANQQNNEEQKPAEQASVELAVQDVRHEAIKSLDAQITYFEQSLSQDHCEANFVFVSALKDLRKELNADIEEQMIKGKKNIENSAAVKIADHATDMLVNLQKPDADKMSVLREFERRCKQVPGWQKFARVICAVCVAGVGFVLGAVIGMSIGIVAGAWTGPGVFVAAAVGLAAGAAKGAAIGVAAGAACMGVASGVGSGALLFKPKGVRKQALNLVGAQLKSSSPAA